MKVEIIQDEARAIQILKHVSKWMKDAGLNPSEWWDPAKFSHQFFEPYAKPDEFYVALVNGKPAACVILQDTKQNMQDWSSVDGNKHRKALYIHYLAVEREFASKGLSKALMNFAEGLAKTNALPILRLDTDVDEPNLTGLYEGLGFKSLMVLEEDYRRTVLYEKVV